MSAPATTASATATAAARSGAATLTAQMISPAACALTTLAFLHAAAPAGGGRECGGVGLTAAVAGDPDGDVIQAGRFVHAWHGKRGI